MTTPDGGPKDCGSGHSDPDQCHVGSPAVEGSCDTHGACPQLPEPVAELRRMIEGLPGGQVRLTEAEETQIGDYARDFPEYVSINFERKAAQIKSCSDAAIVAHVPLSDHALRVLAANNA